MVLFAPSENRMNILKGKNLETIMAKLKKNNFPGRKGRQLESGTVMEKRKEERTRSRLPSSRGFELPWLGSHPQVTSLVYQKNDRILELGNLSPPFDS